MVNNEYLPFRSEILEVIKHAELEYTFRMSYDRGDEHPVKPGQFFEISIPKYGEAPISVSGITDHSLDFTIRRVGSLTDEIFENYVGDYFFMRGPYGNGFDVNMFKGKEMKDIITYGPENIGFISGGLLLFIGDRIFTKIDKKISKNKDENNKTKSLKRCIMLILSITLHNIPEGLAVGVAFGGIAYGIEGATLSSAIMIALGIGIQNFPEGTAVSVPLRREGLSRKKAFFFGQLSGLVEPISGVLGALLVLKVRTLLPFLLSFAAGAMIYVVVEELIPESQTNKRKELMALFTLIGFSIMMILDVSLG